MISQDVKSSAIHIIPGNIRERLLESLDRVYDLWVVIRVFYVGNGTFFEFGLIHLCSSITNNFAITREETKAIKAEKCR